MRENLLRNGLLWRQRVLLGGTFLVPVLFLRNLNDPINVPKLGLLMAVVVVAGSLRLAEILQGADRTGLTQLWVPATAVAVPLTVGFVFSPYRAWATFGHYPRFLGLVPYLIIIFFGVLLADAFRGAPEPIAWALVSAGGLAGAYACVQVAGLDPFEWEAGGLAATGAVSTLGNPNFAGGFFGITLPIAAGLIEARPDLRWRSVPLALLALGGWLAAGSEGGWLAGVAGGAVVTASLTARRIPAARWVGVGVAALCGILAVGAVLAAFDERQAARLPSTVERRSEWWSAAGRMTSDSLLVGRGPNSFALEHPRYRTLEDAKLAGLNITDDPHSVLLSFATAAGIFGVLGYVLLLASLFRLGGSAPVSNTWAWAFFGAVVAYAVQALVSIDTVALRAALWTSAAGLAASVSSVAAGGERKTAQKAKTKRNNRPEPIRQLPLMALLPVLAAVPLWWAVEFINADAQLRTAATEFRASRVEAAQASYEAAIAHRGEIAYRRAYGTALGAVALALESNGAFFIGKAEETFSYIDDVPHVNSIRALAVILRDWGATNPAVRERALSLYERVLRLDPSDPELLSEAALAAISFEQPQRAVEMLQAQVHRVDDARVWGAFALAQARSGSVEEATAAAQRAFELDPSQPSAVEASDLLDEQQSHRA